MVRSLLLSLSSLLKESLFLLISLTIHVLNGELFMLSLVDAANSFKMFHSYAFAVNELLNSEIELD